MPRIGQGRDGRVDARCGKAGISLRFIPAYGPECQWMLVSARRERPQSAIGRLKSDRGSECHSFPLRRDPASVARVSEAHPGAAVGLTRATCRICSKCGGQANHSQPTPSLSRSRCGLYPGSPRRTDAAPAARASAQFRNARPFGGADRSRFRRKSSVPDFFFEPGPRWQW